MATPKNPQQAAKMKALMDQIKAAGIQLDTALKEANASLKQQGDQLNLNTEAAIRMAQALAEGKDAVDAANEVNKQVYGDLRETNTLYEENLLLQQTNLDALNQISQVVQSNADVSAQEREGIEASLAYLSAQVKLEERRSQISGQNVEHINKQVKASEQFAKYQVEANKEIRIAGNRLKFTQKAVAEVGEETVKKTGRLKDFGGKVKKALGFGAVAVGAYAGNKLLEQAEEFASKAQANYMALNTFTKGFSELTGQVMNSDFAVRSFGEEGKNLQDSIIEIQRTNAQLGVTLGDVTESLSTLAAESRTFGTLMARNTPASAAQAKALVSLAARMKTVGVSTSSTAKAMEILGKTYRVTNIVGETEAFGEMMVNVARATGQTVDQVGTQAVAAFDKLSVYSLPQAKQIFKELSVTAAETGVSVDTMMTMAGQFDQIDGAASSVGNLNAMLGGPYLNTLDMVNATEEERISMIREAIEASGESVEDMDRYKQKAIANELKLTAAQSKRLFGVQQEVIEAGTSAVDTNKKSMADMTQSLTDGAAKNAVAIDRQFAAAKDSIVMVEGALGHVEKAAHSASGVMIKLGGDIRDRVSGHLLSAAKDMEAHISKTSEAVRRGDSPLKAAWDLGVGTLEVTAKGLYAAGEELMGTRTAPARAQTGMPLSEAFETYVPGSQGGMAAEPAGAPGGGPIEIHNKLYLDNKVIWEQIDRKVDVEIRKALER